MTNNTRALPSAWACGPTDLSQSSLSQPEALVPNAVEVVRTWLDHGRNSFGQTIPVAALYDVLNLAAPRRQTLLRARGWLNLVAVERPATSDVHSVLAELDRALATQEQPK